MCLYKRLPECEITDHKNNASHELSTISGLANFVIRLFTVGVVEYCIQGPIPSSNSGHLEQQDKRLEEGFEVVHVIEATSDLHVLKQTHSEDSKNEHDKEEKKTDVEEGRKRHDKREKKSSDALSSLDEPENSANFGNPDYPKKGGRDEVLLNQVTEKESGKRQEDNNKIEEIPRLSKIMVAKGKHFHEHFCSENDDEPETDYVSSGF